MSALNIDVYSPFDVMSKDTCRVFDWINHSIEKHVHDSKNNNDRYMFIDISIKTIVDDQKEIEISNTKEPYPDYRKEIVNRSYLIKRLYELKGWTVKFIFDAEMGSFGGSESDRLLFIFDRRIS